MTSEGIQEPVPRPLQARLRRAALDHALAERRRSFASLLHVGDPGGAEQLFTLLPREPADHALRADVVAALLHRSPRPDPIVWGTRPGGLVVEDVDLGWLSGARPPAARAGGGVEVGGGARGGRRG